MENVDGFWALQSFSIFFICESFIKIIKSFIFADGTKLVNGFSRVGLSAGGLKPENIDWTNQSRLRAVDYKSLVLSI
jgi:hypothetical protein